MARKLTPKQEKFCLVYLETGNATAAYKAAYDCKRMKPASINRKAIECLQNGMIAARIERSQKVASDKAELSAAWVIERLMRNARICMGEEKIKLTVLPKGADRTIEIESHARDEAGANKALELLGKTMGIFIDKVETSNEQFVVGVDKPMTEDAFERAHIKMGLAAATRPANGPH